MYTPILLPSHNPNTYPSRPPGFDPTHPMAKGIVPGHGFSGIATGNGGFISLVTGAPGVKTGTNPAKIDPYIGQNWTNPSGTNGFDWSGQLAEAETKGTFGSIIINNAAGTFFFNTSSTNAGIAQGFTTAGNAFNFNFNGVATESSITTTWVAGVPYFFACSAGTVGTNTVVNFCVRNLKTGIIQTETRSFVGVGTANTGNGTYRLGNRAGAFGITGSIAAMMYAPFFATLLQLYNWALDPWAFWYPHTVLDTFDWPRAPLPPPPILRSQICM